jgi:hypothetical protein
MANFVLIYDTFDDVTKELGPKAAAHHGAQAIGVDSIGKLKAELSRLKSAGGRIDQMLVYTHGAPGALILGTDWVNANSIRNHLGGNGFEDLFTPGARVFLPGCEIAAVKAGCGPSSACWNTDNGLDFLLTFAKTLLFKGGGRVGGWDSAGRSGFLFPEPKMYHLVGEVYYAYINQGGTRSRIAAGRERSSPEGVWEVSVSNDSRKRLYVFTKDAQVRYKFASGKDARGTWKMQGDWLRIAWEWGGSDTWDLPLYDRYQTGICGVDIELTARRRLDLSQRAGLLVGRQGDAWLAEKWLSIYD